MKSAFLCLGFLAVIAGNIMAKELNFNSLADGEYILTADSQVVKLPICEVSFAPKLYSKQMEDGIGADKHPVVLGFGGMVFVSNHPLRDDNPFDSQRIILSELAESAGLWRRFRDVPLSVKKITGLQNISILSPAEELKPGARYALFFDDALTPLGTVIPFSDDLRQGAYYFTLSDSTGR